MFFARSPASAREMPSVGGTADTLERLETPARCRSHATHATAAKAATRPRKRYDRRDNRRR